ncbi:MAG: NapC/NirT family cytochrome c, partial [Dehalococcoidales bacterium]|nr:NapC/NirT family cytochrome c [Dehalococcoidales bacterium]
MFSNPTRTKLILLIAMGAFSLVLLTIGAYQLFNFTESNSFCGKLCHTVMAPEYTTYQASPHARVDCVTCHVGKGVSFFVKAKINGIPQIYYTLTGTYPRPITSPVANLRPARDTCEQCHQPQKFTGDLIRFYTTFDKDENNTKTTRVKALRVGGGGDSPQDIHWHIGATVWYLPMDATRQNIGWVGVESADGTLKEWIDPAQAAEITPDRIQKEKRLMDCIDCHNRATHIYYSPEQLIDKAMAEGSIDPSLPYVKLNAMNALDPINDSLKAAYTKVEKIADFYKITYPQIYTQKTAAIQQMVTKLKSIADLTTFPDMKVDYTTHPNNIGHQQSPGCFRCHGKLE